jgi:hypothetical protein
MSTLIFDYSRYPYSPRDLQPGNLKDEVRIPFEERMNEKFAGISQAAIRIKVSAAEDGKSIIAQSLSAPDWMLPELQRAGLA